MNRSVPYLHHTLEDAQVKKQFFGFVLHRARALRIGYDIDLQIKKLHNTLSEKEFTRCVGVPPIHYCQLLAMCTFVEEGAQTFCLGERVLKDLVSIDLGNVKVSDIVPPFKNFYIYLEDNAPDHWTIPGKTPWNSGSWFDLKDKLPKINGIYVNFEGFAEPTNFPNDINAFSSSAYGLCRLTLTSSFKGMKTHAFSIAHSFDDISQNINRLDFMEELDLPLESSNYYKGTSSILLNNFMMSVLRDRIANAVGAAPLEDLQLLISRGLVSNDLHVEMESESASIALLTHFMEEGVTMDPADIHRMSRAAWEIQQDEKEDSHYDYGEKQDKIFSWLNTRNIITVPKTNSIVIDNRIHIDLGKGTGLSGNLNLVDVTKKIEGAVSGWKKMLLESSSLVYNMILYLSSKKAEVKKDKSYQFTSEKKVGKLKNKLSTIPKHHEKKLDKAYKRIVKEQVRGTVTHVAPSWEDLPEVSSSETAGVSETRRGHYVRSHWSAYWCGPNRRRKEWRVRWCHARGDMSNPVPRINYVLKGG